jgi:hypothetical protein
MICLFESSLTSRAGTNMVLRFDGATGKPAPAGDNNGANFVAADSGGLDALVLLIFTETHPTTLAHTGTSSGSGTDFPQTTADAATVSNAAPAPLALAPMPDPDGSNGWVLDPTSQPRQRAHGPGDP